MKSRLRESTTSPRTATAVPPHLAIIPGCGDFELHEGRRPELVPPGKPTLAWRPRMSVAVAFGVALLAFLMWAITMSSRANMVERLPVDQRAALFQRTRANLHDICREVDRPREFCREQAQLLLHFPECGDACVASARNELMADSARK